MPNLLALRAYIKNGAKQNSTGALLCLVGGHSSLERGS